MAVFSLTLVRHGETNSNRESVIQGQKDTELSQQGLIQAQLAGRRLQFDRYTHVYSSDLRRAQQTCDLIMQENKVSNAQITHDHRLRERKFGIYEGRPSTDLMKAARREKKNVSNFIPEGGESAKEVRERAINFFEDLIKFLRNLLRDSSQQTEGSITGSFGSGGIKRRRRHTSGSNVFPDSPVGDNVTLLDDEEEDDCCIEHQVQQQHSNSGSTSSTSGCSSATTDMSEDGNESSSTTTPVSSSITVPNSMLGRDFQDNVTSTPSPTQAIFDLEIRTNVSPPPQATGEEFYKYGGGCPNVSLSPICEHRPSTISSVSSGRNSSFDEGDMVPSLLADVLIVAHGGLLKELVNYFIDTLGCKIPGSEGYIHNVSPNTGISKFTVTLNEGENDPPRLTCLTIHDKDHLS